MWSVMLYGTCKQTDHGCTSCPTSMMSLRSQPLSSASLLKNKPREQHECTNLMHSDLAWDAGALRVRRKGARYDRLPLPHEVGAALVAYLRDGRPPSTTRQVFV